MSDAVDVRCKGCGATFSTFLQQMAEHNQKIVCPKCGQAHAPSELRNSQPTKPKK